MKSATPSLLAGILMLAATSHGVLVMQPGYTAAPIYSGTWLGGFGTDGSSLYVGDSSTVYSMDAAGGNVQSVGALPAGEDNSVVNASPVNGTIYAAIGSYTPPFPYQFGRYTSGTFVQNQVVNGLYDSAFDAAGNMFLSANHEDYTGDGTNDTAVYFFDQDANQLTRVAEVGGVSGGLALNDEGDLFYGAGSGVVSFDAAELAAAAAGGGALTLADATLESATSSSYLAFDADGNLYATRLDAFWNTELVAIDGAGVATVIGNGGGGHLAVIGNTIYTGGNDYSDFSSNIYAVEAVPEPSSVILLLGGFGGLAWFRKRRKYILRR